jgi:hypothetical protein
LFRSPGKGNRNQLFGAFKQDSPARAEYGAAQRAGPERWRGFRLTGPLQAPMQTLLFIVLVVLTLSLLCSILFIWWSGALDSDAWRNRRRPKDDD